MRVRLTVTPRIESPGPGSVDREAGANPARTRHCHRGSPSHARASHWSRQGPGRREGEAREPGDLPPTTSPTPRGRGWLLQPHRPAGLLAGLLCPAAAAPAAAAPVTVDLRIEGRDRTLFEGPVTTDVRSFRFTGDVEHICDGTSGNGGPSASPVPTRGAVLTQAAEQTPFAVHGSWSDQFGSPTIDEVAGEDTRFD